MKTENVPSKLNYSLSVWLLVFFAIIYSVALSVSYVSMAITNKNLDKIKFAKDEAERPSNINITVIKSKSCQECFDASPFVEAIKKQKVKVVSEKEIDFSSEEGKELVKKYSITKIPAVIISGEIERDRVLKDYLGKAGEIKDGIFILKNIGNPYVSADTGEVKGKVKLMVVIDKSCSICFDSSAYANIMKRQLGMFIEKEEMFDIASKEAREIVKKNDITGVPAIVLSGDLLSYPALNQIGVIKNGNFVLNKINPPYREIKSGKIRGKVDAAVISDKSCAGCFDVKNYDQVFGGFGIKFGQKINYDAQDAAGKKMIKKYNIKLLPTIILSGDVLAYEQLVKIWNNAGIGSVEGTDYVLREGVKQLGAYKDLESGNIVNPAEQK